MNATNQSFADDGQRYRLESRIATGGMGEVWRATDTLLGREVAVKLLKLEFADDPTFRRRFETEARHAASLHHPGIAAVFDVGERTLDDGTPHRQPFLVMELVPGEPLSALLLAGRELDALAVRGLLAQVGDALGAAHRAGIVHRDVKPANLIVTPDRQVKVTDFGIARAADAAGITRTGAVMGTPQYLSPEQAEGRPATSASDVYALGVVAFECLAGRRPFEADSPVATALAHVREPVPELPASVPADLAAVVRRALSKTPGDRFPDGAAFADALRNPTSAVPVPKPAPAPVPPPVPEDRTQVLDQVVAPSPAPPPVRAPSSPWPIVIAVMLAVALVMVLGYLLLRGEEEPEPPSRTTPATSASETTPAETTSEKTSAAESATINEDSYLGEDIDTVKAAISALGFTDVRTEQLANSEPTRDGEVTAVSPSGTQDLDTTITISFYEDAPEETSSPPETSTTPDEPTETSSEPPTESSADPSTLIPPDEEENN